MKKIHTKEQIHNFNYYGQLVGSVSKVKSNLDKIEKKYEDRGWKNSHLKQICSTNLLMKEIL